MLVAAPVSSTKTSRAGLITALPGPPVGAPLGDVGPVLLLRPARLFLRVSPSRASVLCISPRLADTPWVASSQARSSSSVTSGRRATSAAIAS